MWVFYLFAGSVIVIIAADVQNNPNYLDNCGYDFTGSSNVIEGEGRLENYPWVGILLFPIGSTRVTSVVVLVTRQMVIGSASEIDKLPKNHFRALSRVVLGTNSSGPRIKIREYTYHGEYGTETSSSLALLQLELDHVKFDVRPICGPPTHFFNIHIYAITLNEDSQYPILTIQEMEHVNNQECERFYRRNGLDERNMWPTRTTCARAKHGTECLWRSGAALAAKLGGRWHLLGFGVTGPGCHAPSRFIDYGPYVSWVKRSVERIGSPAITRLGPGHVILRRSVSSLQRFGVCDAEELVRELYTDQFKITESDKTHKIQRVRYNISLSDELEYSCVNFQVFHNMKNPTPFLRLRRWCSAPTGDCYGYQFVRIDFYVEIEFVSPMTFRMSAYGRHPTVIDIQLVMKYFNKMHRRPKGPRVADATWKNHLIESKHLYWIRNKNRTIRRKKLILNYIERTFLKSYRVNIKKDFNLNQHIYNRTVAESLFGRERTDYFEFLIKHCFYNPDAINDTRELGLYSQTSFERYKFLKAKFGHMTVPGTTDDDKR